MGLATVEAKPKAHTLIPVARPLLSLNQSMRVLTGLRYIIPIPLPVRQPKPTYKRIKDFSTIDKLVTSNPLQNKAVPIMVDLCMFFSTIEPPNAAAIPKKNIANEKANWTLLCE